MIALVAADSFDGKTIAVAQFADGNQFLYYDGELVQQSANGLVLAGRTAVADLANDLERQFEPIGWEVDANVDENAVAQDGSIMAFLDQSLQRKNDEIKQKAFQDKLGS